MNISRRELSKGSIVGGLKRDKQRECQVSGTSVCASYVVDGDTTNPRPSRGKSTTYRTGHF